MIYERGDVVLIRFPFTDLKGSKQRPALVISTAEYNRRGQDVVVAAVSSARVEDPQPFDHAVKDWKAAGLLHPSVVRAGKIVTLHRSTIRRRLGSIGDTDLRAVGAKIEQALGLS